MEGWAVVALGANLTDMKTRIANLGDAVMAVAWPMLFGLAILTIAVGRMLGLGEREASR